MSKRLADAPVQKEHGQIPSLSAVALAIFVGQRLLFGLVVLLAVSYLSYLGLDMAGGVSLGEAIPRAARETVSYWGNLARGDLGMSIAGSSTYAAVPVAEVLPDRFGKSLGLLFASLAFAAVVGVGLGVWSAKRRHTIWSLATLVLSTIGVSVPSFFAALLLQIGVIRWTRMSGSALLPVGGFGWDEHLILPALVLAARPIAQIARVTSVTLGDVLDQDFVRTAHSKGVSPRVVMQRHILRNAAIPILTTVGVSLRFALSSLPVVEYFFNWTGMGFTLLKSIARRDDDMTVGLVLCLGLLFVLVNLLLEIAYRIIDPRLRERMSRAEQQERENLVVIIRSTLIGLWEWLRHLVVWRRLLRKQEEQPDSPFQGILEQRGIEVDLESDVYREQRRRSWIRGTVSNLPFVLGLFVVVGLILIIGFGPSLTSHSPYTKRGLEYSDGELSVPPFSPSELYLWGTDPLGRDIFSLVVAGTPQTLLLAAVVVSVRIALGLLLGSIAGWWSGSWMDRLLLRGAEIVSAFPTLLLSMMLILALGIRQGLRSFVIALSFVGWGEVMQFVRGRVMEVRVKPFIESAVAAGLRTPRLIWNHVLPNLLSSMISVSALEMGAVLMLLGELGFVGIFIGGGAFAELYIDAPPYHYSDVPEWGALLSNIRLYARSYPWTAFYPALAFFVAIVGFNLFGEGIRRMVETVGLGFTRIVNKYTIGLALIAALSYGWAKSHTGSAAYYRRQASAFDGERARSHAVALASPEMQGRALGTVGQDLAVDYIANAFQSVGLQPGGEDLGYFQHRTRSFELLGDIPELSVVGREIEFEYREDFVEFPASYRNLGHVQGGRVRILLMGELTLVRTTYAGSSYKALRDMDFEGDVVMVFSARQALDLERLGLDGILVVAQDEDNLTRRYTLSSRDPLWQTYGTGREQGQDTPIFWLSERAADQILDGTGHTVADLRLANESLAQDEVIDLPTDVRVSMDIQGEILVKIPVRHVIGHLAGESDSRYGGINAQTIVVLAQYDSPPPSPDGALYPAANDNASGVGVMIEAVRTMQQTGYQPYRTFLFIAYSGEGLEGGEPVIPSDVDKFLQAHLGFSANLDVEAIVHLRGVGAGSGDAITLSAMGSQRLSRLFQRAARQMRADAQLAEDDLDISIVFEEKSRWEGGQVAPEMSVRWEGWEATSRLSGDVPQDLSAQKMERAGRMVTLALMTLGRELEY
jgi:peptide/nickel transport system permease protein